MLGWHHRLNGHEFEQAQGDGEGQEGSPVRCHPRNRDESDTTERLNNNNNNQAQELYSVGFRGYQGRRRRQLKDGGDRIWGCA